MIGWFKRRFLRKKEATKKPASVPSAGFSSFGYYAPPPPAPPAPSNTMRDMLLGGLIGHAIGSHHTPAPEPTQSYTPSPSYDAPRNDYCAPSYSSPSYDSGSSSYDSGSCSSGGGSWD